MAKPRGTRAKREPRARGFTGRPRFSEAVIAAAVKAGQRLNRFGVRHASWGVISRAGIRIPEAGVVLFVERKLPKDKLPTEHVLPRTLAVKSGTRTRHVPVDVQEIPHGRKQALYAGHRARIHDGTDFATLSALFDGPNGLAACISGHAAKQYDNIDVTLGNGHVVRLGQVAVSYDNTTIDAARVDGIDAANVPYMSSASPSLRDVGNNDVGLVLTVWLVSGPVSASIDNADVQALFDKGPMFGLVRLSACISIEGDSGAPALDDSNRLVGFVVGCAGGLTHLMPARKALDALL